MSKVNKIEIINLNCNIGGKQVLKNINLEIKSNEITTLIGPNGAGKSTISNVLMGNPKYRVTSGKILFNGEDITNKKTDERAKMGLFMSFQQPAEISGVTLFNFLRTGYNSIKGTKINVSDFRKLLKEKQSIIEMDSKFNSRFVNFGFSGGEKKRSEILQFLLFEPKYLILDEIDSGLDVDALKTILKVINEYKKTKEVGIFMITHYYKILEHLNPDKVYILKNGEIVESGDYSLAKKILENGFN